MLSNFNSDINVMKVTLNAKGARQKKIVFYSWVFFFVDKLPLKFEI